MGSRSGYLFIRFVKFVRFVKFIKILKFITPFLNSMSYLRCLIKAKPPFRYFSAANPLINVRNYVIVPVSALLYFYEVYSLKIRNLNLKKT
jgi:hypothetical protein